MNANRRVQRLILEEPGGTPNWVGQGALVLGLVVFVFVLGCLAAAVMDKPGPTWMQRAQNPMLSNPDMEPLLRRARWERHQAAEGAREEKP